jgi:hypothetical protein
MYLDTNLFMTPPVMPMQGMMLVNARASFHDRMYAITKPVRNAEMKLTESATFSDMPCWTRSEVASDCHSGSEQ